MRLLYSDEALADLLRLRTFIAENDDFVATRVAEELVSRIEYLTLFPQMGRAVRLAPQSDAVRDFVFGKYIVRYTLHTQAIIILRIWHHYESREPSI